MTLNIIINGQGPEPTDYMNLSGGTVRLIEIMKRISIEKDVKLYVLSSEGVSNTFKKNKIKANYIIISSTIKHTKSYTKLLIDSLFRITKVCFVLPPARNCIVYAGSDFLWDVFPAFIWKLKNKNVKWIQLIFHLIPSNRLISHYAQKFSFFFIKRFADLVIVDNYLLKEELVAQGFDAKNIEVNPPGINTGYFKDIKSVKEKSYDSCFLGRLHPSKGIFDLIDIWKLILKKKQNAKLAIIGGGNKRLEDELKKKIMDANLEHNIAIMGYLEDDKAFEILKSSKVFISPSHEEGFGIAILEGMACGLPVVAWDLPVYREVFPKGIIRVPTGNIEEFAWSILDLLEDSKLYGRISKEAREMSLRYDWDKIVKRELELIDNLNLRTQRAPKVT